MSCFIKHCKGEIVGYINPNSGCFFEGDPNKLFPPGHQKYKGLCWCKHHEKQIIDAIKKDDDGESLNNLYKKYGGKN